ncbi:MAG TPA: hypothetical protein V6C76_06155 [Drouetiella sp.]
MNRFLKSGLLVGALLSIAGASLCAPAQANNNNYLNNMAVQMYANNVAHGMNPLTGGIYSPYVQAAVNGNNNWNRHNRHWRNNNNCGYYNSNYGYAPYGYGASGYNPYGYGGYGAPSVWGQLINGYGY